MASIADGARHRPDAKVRALLAWIRQHMLDGRRWNDERLLVFTEYDDTKRYLVEQLQAALQDADDIEARIDVYHGPTPLVKREKLKRAFNADPKKHPLRILIATDAAREGLNLQNHCRALFHFDLPWNPGRLEQRNGRIDRKLQKADAVACHYFVYAQRPEDRVLAALVRKTDTIRRELGSLSQVLDDGIAAQMKFGIRRSKVEEQAKAITAADLEQAVKDTVERELEAARNRQETLAAQIEALRTDLARSRAAIRFDEVAFRDALSCSLELQKAPPLRETAAGTFAFPDVEKLPAAEASWTDTMDSLRTPRERDQKPWEWRRAAAIRPVVFEDQGDLDDGKVHLHLEHRIAQRLLGRFRAQGFVNFDLSRACLTQTKDPIPRVLLLGRLALYGPHAARLHEEMLVVAARWVDPKLRKGAPLQPLAAAEQATALEMLEESLTSGSKKPLDRVVQQRLAESLPQDLADLRPHLAALGAAKEASARELLGKRGGDEAAAMAEILAQQKKGIVATQKKEDRELLGFEQQLLPGLREQLDADLRQLQSNRKHWERRLAEIEAEAKEEPKRIRALYEVQAARIEPVGIAYLYPQGG
jgi:hypothetical protein